MTIRAPANLRRPAPFEDEDDDEYEDDYNRASWLLTPPLELLELLGEDRSHVQSTSLSS